MIDQGAISLALRRVSVVATVAAALLLGTAAIRASADWTASNAPLTTTPASADQVAADVAAQRNRAAALRDEVRAAADEAAHLRAAIAAAQAQLRTDAAGAGAMREQLASAAARLASLEGQIAAARERLDAITAASVPDTLTAGAGHGHDDEDDHEDHDDHEDDDD